MHRAQHLLQLRRRWLEGGKLAGELEARLYRLAARALIAAHGFVEWPRPRERLVQRFGTELRAQERVHDPHGRDVVAVVPRVTDERPPRSVRLSEVVRDR